MHYQNSCSWSMSRNEDLEICSRGSLLIHKRCFCKILSINFWEKILRTTFSSFRLIVELNLYLKKLIPGLRFVSVSRPTGLVLFHVYHSYDYMHQILKKPKLSTKQHRQTVTTQKIKCSIKDFFSKYEQIRRVLFAIIDRSLAPTKIFLQLEVLIELLLLL